MKHSINSSSSDNHNEPNKNRAVQADCCRSRQGTKASPWIPGGKEGYSRGEAGGCRGYTRSLSAMLRLG